MSSGAGLDSSIPDVRVAPDISGDWDGVYAYGGRHQYAQAVGFKALFTVADPVGGFAGVITDADGIGEAGVSGALEGRTIWFVKIYRWSLFARTAPIRYAGTLAGDGQTADGTWQISSRLFGLIPQRVEGTWRMQRSGLPPMQMVWPPLPQAPTG